MSAKARKSKKKKKTPRGGAAGGSRGRSTATRAGKKRGAAGGKKAKAPKKKKTAVAKKKAPAKKATSRRRKAAKPSRASKVRSPRLTPRQRERYRELLLLKQRELTQAYYLSKSNSISDLDDGTEDYIDYAVHSYAREFLLSLTELDRKQLFLVEEALERVRGGEYGRCCQCGRAIHLKRLDVAPWARYCLPCQELEEKGLLPQFGSVEAEEAAGSDDQDETGEEKEPVDANDEESAQETED